MVLFAIGEAPEGYTMERALIDSQPAQRCPNEAIVLRPVSIARGIWAGWLQRRSLPFCGIEEQRIDVAQVAGGDTIC